MHKKILIMGLPGAGKTTLAHALAPKLKAVHFNADEVRHHLNKDLGFAEADRIEHARRMGWLCDQVGKSGALAIADFVCPTPATRAAFVEGGPALLVWVDRIKSGRFADTNRMFVPPEHFDLRVTEGGSARHWADRVAGLVRPTFDTHKASLDPHKATALLIGRFQPFSPAHRALILETCRRVGQVCIGVRSGGSNEPAGGFEHVRARIERELSDVAGSILIVDLPNVSHIFHGGDSSCIVQRIDVDGLRPPLGFSNGSRFQEQQPAAHRQDTPAGV